ncbi:MAG: hypothetical protein V4593_13985, partial [Pseudomonadota bacterium]
FGETKKSELPPGNPRPTDISELKGLKKKKKTASTGAARTVSVRPHGSRIQSGMTTWPGLLWI